MKFKEVGEAYSVLSDQKKRTRYDQGHDMEDLDGFGGGGFNSKFSDLCKNRFLVSTVRLVTFKKVLKSKGYGNRELATTILNGF
ncbi:hypothetical protein DPMN_183600 [Dreissena polymorpha]|uniref:J domain-containing protein n=1 Tax=Dreissena polymorpha TaxID=45954 RepID=A0A9D4I5N9_DREPO|nr:hypothetical protein DPMN_183600 [Dreissena polymorpha]